MNELFKPLAMSLVFPGLDEKIHTRYNYESFALMFSLFCEDVKISNDRTKKHTFDAFSVSSENSIFIVNIMLSLSLNIRAFE